MKSEPDFIAKACRREDQDERQAALYDEIYEEVEAEHFYEHVHYGDESWTYRPQGQKIHAEVVKRMQQHKNSLQD